MRETTYGTEEIGERISLPRTETNAHKKTAEFPGKFDGVIFKSKLT